MMRPAVFLDRDGVINRAVMRGHKPRAPRSLDELELLPGVGEAVSALRAGGYCVIVVTNQPDVARGVTPAAVVDSINERIRAELRLDAVYTCVHDDRDACACRKPKPGLLVNAARDRGIDLATSFMVGDRWRDTDAGLAAGCRAIFIDRGYSERKPERFAVNVAGLPEAAAWILEQT